MLLAFMLTLQQWEKNEYSAYKNHECFAFMLSWQQWEKMNTVHIYENHEFFTWLPLSLLLKKSKQRGVEGMEFPGVSKEFPRAIKKVNVDSLASRGPGFLGVIFYDFVHNSIDKLLIFFCKIAEFLGLKLSCLEFWRVNISDKKPKNSSGFFKKVYPQSPLFGFFGEDTTWK